MPAKAGHLPSLHLHCYDPNTVQLALDKVKGRSSLAVRRVRIKKKKIQRSPAFLFTRSVSLLSLAQFQLYHGAWPLLSQGCPREAAEPPGPGSCAPDSPAATVLWGVESRRSSLIFPLLLFARGAGKTKGKVYRGPGGTVTGHRELRCPRGQHSRQGCRLALGCVGLTRAKTDRSWVACLPCKMVTVCILTHSPRHCSRQNAQQHLGLRTLRARINFHFRGSYMECKMVPPLGSLTT